MVRDIAIFEPTHLDRESGTSIVGMQASRRGRLYALKSGHLQADVGSAKQWRGHPPGTNRVKLLLYTANAGLSKSLTPIRCETFFFILIFQALSSYI